MARQYAELVWLLRLTVFAVASLSCALPTTRIGWTQNQPAPPKDQMFSGTVTAVGDNSLTVVRTGSTASKTFTVTPQTLFEGPKPQVNSRVTIRYVAGEEGDRAVRVIVRAPANNKR